MIIRRQLQIIQSVTRYRQLSTSYNTLNKWAKPADLKLPQDEQGKKKTTTEKQTQRQNQNQNTSRKANVRNNNKDNLAKPLNPTQHDVQSDKRNEKFSNNKKKSKRSSLINSLDDEITTPSKKDKKNMQQPKSVKSKDDKDKAKGKNKANKPAKRQVFVPAFISVANLSRLFNIRLGTLSLACFNYANQVHRPIATYYDTCWFGKCAIR